MAKPVLCLAVFDRYGSGLLPERLRYVCTRSPGHSGAHLGSLMYEEERRYADWDKQEEEKGED